jgi:hypothetical protein
LCSALDSGKNLAGFPNFFPCHTLFAYLRELPLSGARQMTLLVAAVEGPNIWMIADAAITGGDLSYRSREFELKVMSSRDGRALVGFAGDHHHGVRLVNTAAEMAAGQDTVNFLC